MTPKVQRALFDATEAIEAHKQAVDRLGTSYAEVAETVARMTQEQRNAAIIQLEPAQRALEEQFNTQIKEFRESVEAYLRNIGTQESPFKAVFQDFLDNRLTLQEFIDFDNYIRCICVGQDKILPIQYDPKQIGPTGLRGNGSVCS